MIYRFFISLLIFLFWSVFAQAAATNVDCSSSTTVGTAITNASNEDVLTCTAGGTWAGTVTIPASKSITFNGGGYSINGRLDVTAHASLNTRITNFVFTKSDATNVTLTAGVDDAAIRLDNTTFSGTGSYLLWIFGLGPILVDNCTFTGAAANEVVHVWGGGADDASTWTDAYTPGTSPTVIFEDNTFNGPASGNPAWLQVYYGARVVGRYNTFNNWSIDFHGSYNNPVTQHAGRWWEFYHNNFTNTADSNQGAIFNMRGGSGLLYANDRSGGVRGGISLGEEQIPTEAYPSNHQIGRGQSNALYPAYIWGNTSLTVSLNACECVDVDPDNVALNRDVYYPSSGTSNPASCTVGQGFWRTDESKLYKCTETDTWTEYYAPYTYPHPLQDPAPTQYALTLTITGTGSGTVSSSPPGISSSSSTSGNFDDDTEVTLTATATSPNYFAGWSGAGCSGTSTCVVTMSEARAVTATFSLYGTMTAGSGGSIVSGAGGSITVQ